MQNQVSGKLVTLVPTDLAHTLFQEWLLTFTHYHPLITLEVLPTDSLSNLHAEPIDLALHCSTPIDSNLIAKKLSDSRRIACASPAYLAEKGAVVTPEDLVGHNCLCYHLSNQLDNQWHFYKGKEQYSVKVSGNLATNDSSLALAGKGVVYKSELELRADIQTGRLRPILESYLG